MANRVGEPLKWRVARILSYGVQKSGLLWLCERLRPKQTSGARLIVLCYHRVTTDDSTIRTICVSPENFRSQMAYLAHGPYKPISLTTWQRHLEGTETLKGDYVAVTFDDGYRDNYANAFPILRETGVPATIFLTTDAIDSQEPRWWDRVVMSVRELRKAPDLVRSASDRVPESVRSALNAAVEVDENLADGAIVSLVIALKSLDAGTRGEFLRLLDGLAPCTKTDLMMTWDMIRAMRGDVVEFGSHTVTHPFMSRLTDDEARAELSRSKQRIETELGATISSFAYPNGKRADYTPQTLALLEACGYALALTTEKNVNDRQTPPLEMYRFGTVDYPAYVLAVRLCAILAVADIRRASRFLFGRS